MPRHHRLALACFLLAGTMPAASAMGGIVTGPPTHLFSWGGSGTAPGQFSTPVQLTTDAAGDVYIVDQNNHRIQKFDRTGQFLAQWGSLGSSPGQFNYPAAVAVDKTGNVYVADNNNHRIQKFTNTGGFVAQWGSYGSAPGQFSSPSGVAVDPAGNVYVADTFNQRVQKFTATGTPLAQWGTAGTGDGQFSYLSSLAIDANGYVYVADTFNHRIQKFTSAGVFVTRWGSQGASEGQFQTPVQVAVDAVGNVYVADQNNHRIQKFGSSGTFLAKWGSNGTGAGQFSNPSGVTADPAGNLYVADQSNQRIQKFSGAGIALPYGAPSLLTWWGSSAAGGVATDAAGNVYITDNGSGRVQKFTSTGDYLTEWNVSSPEALALDASGTVYVSCALNSINKYSDTGTSLGGWTASMRARGVAVDASGNVYVADSNNHLIRKFASSGTPLLQWGSPGSGNGQFNSPRGVAVDAAGNVYVSDLLNYRIQKFTSTGAFLLKWGSFGGGDGQFNGPIGVAVDGVGNVHISDTNYRIETFTGSGVFLGSRSTVNSPNWIAVDAAGSIFVTETNSYVGKYVTAPTIAMVADVGNDQGRQTQIRFLRSSADSPASGATVTGYEVYRRIEPLPSPTHALPAASTSTTLAGWTWLTTVPAHGESEYNVVVPTLADATPATTYFTSYFVRAATTIPFNYYDSGVESGWSVDNLAPATPTPFTAAYASGATNLHWGTSGAADFSAFRLYRGTSASFSPGPGNLVAITPDTGYVDPGAAGSYYKLSAMDRNGNESAYALVSPGTTVSVPEAGLPTRVELAGAIPNPIAAGGSFQFALPRAMPVRLALYDVAGREVRVLVDGAHPAGVAHVRWDGRDDSGRVVAAGVLLVRLTADGRSLTRRVVTIE